MKTIGLVGGMSWTSTELYYRALNEMVHARLGGKHSARLVLWSVDFAEHLALHDSGGWDAVAEETVDIGRRLRAAGADFLMLGVNTLHVVAEQVEAGVDLPLLHIADPTGAAARGDGLRSVGLLGTRYTMGEAFYRDRLAERHGLEVVVPEGDDFVAVDKMIFDELVVDRYTESSRRTCLEIIGRMVAAGAEGVILGCTELPRLLENAALDVPAYDTLRLHTAAAVQMALD
jgi:aspartate racemase